MVCDLQKKNLCQLQLFINVAIYMPSNMHNRQNDQYWHDKDVGIPKKFKQTMILLEYLSYNVST